MRIRARACVSVCMYAYMTSNTNQTSTEPTRYWLMTKRPLQQSAPASQPKSKRAKKNTKSTASKGKSKTANKAPKTSKQSRLLAGQWEFPNILVPPATTCLVKDEKTKKKVLLTKIVKIFFLKSRKSSNVCLEVLVKRWWSRELATTLGFADYSFGHPRVNVHMHWIVVEIVFWGSFDNRL